MAVYVGLLRKRASSYSASSKDAWAETLEPEAEQQDDDDAPQYGFDDVVKGGTRLDSADKDRVLAVQLHSESLMEQVRGGLADALPTMAKEIS